MLHAIIELENKSKITFAYLTFSLIRVRCFFDKDFYTGHITQENSVAMVFQCFRY